MVLSREKKGVWHLPRSATPTYTTNTERLSPDLGDRRQVHVRSTVQCGLQAVRKLLLPSANLDRMIEGKCVGGEVVEAQIQLGKCQGRPTTKTAPGKERTG